MVGEFVGVASAKADAVRTALPNSDDVRWRSLWQVMQVLVPLPWSQRVWALPFLSGFMPSPSTPLERNQRYKTSLDWAAQMHTCDKKGSILERIDPFSL
jgi:hypothetical protein